MKEENKIAVLGLDGVGKTSLVRTLFSFEDFTFDPPKTSGIEVTEVSLKRDGQDIPILFIDVGGMKVFQVTLWRELVTSDIKAIMYMVDVQTSNRIDSDLNAFRLIIENTNVPILVLGNKYDIINEEDVIYGVNHLFEILDIVEHKINDPFREIIVLPISCKTKYNLDIIIDLLYKILIKNDRN